MTKLKTPARRKTKALVPKRINKAPPSCIRPKQGQYLKTLVYDGLDSIITTFAMVAGVAGASLSAGIVLILGFANLIGDGLPMAIGDYHYLFNQSGKRLQPYRARTRSLGGRNCPEGEKRN